VCWIEGGKGAILRNDPASHYPISSNSIIVWSRSINSSNTNLNTPLPRIILNMAMQKFKVKQPLSSTPTTPALSDLDPSIIGQY
jgi:hypothetical protein